MRARIPLAAVVVRASIATVMAIRWPQRRVWVFTRQRGPSFPNDMNYCEKRFFSVRAVSFADVDVPAMVAIAAFSNGAASASCRVCLVSRSLPQ